MLKEKDQSFSFQTYYIKDNSKSPPQSQLPYTNRMKSIDVNTLQGNPTLCEFLEEQIISH